MTSFSYTQSNLPPRRNETFGGSLSAEWSVSNGTYAYVSGGVLVVKTQDAYSTYHRHWAKFTVTVPQAFSAFRARFKVANFTKPAKSRLQTNVTMYPLPNDVNTIFYCENPASPVVSGTLVVYSDTSNYIEGVDYDVLDYSQGKIRFRYGVPNTWVVKANWERFDYYCIYAWRLRASSDSACYGLLLDFWYGKVKIVRFNGTTNGYDAEVLASVDMSADLKGAGTVRWIQFFAEEDRGSVKGLRAEVYTDSGYTTLESSVEYAISLSSPTYSSGYSEFSAEGKNPSYCYIEIDDYELIESMTNRDGKTVPETLKPARLKLLTRVVRETAGYIFSDTFGSVDPKWTLYGGASISGGKLSLVPTSGSTDYASLAATSSDFVFDCNVKVVTVGAGSSECDIRFRRTDNANEYALSFLTNLGSIKLRKLVGGIWTDIDSTAHSFVNGESLYIRIKTVGTALQIWVWDSNKSLVWSTMKTDSQFSSGNFRITGYDTGSFELDDVAIYTTQIITVLPIKSGSKVKIYDADSSTLIDTYTSTGKVGIDISDISKYLLPNKNIYIKVYSSDESVLYYQMDTMSNIFGGDTWQNYWLVTEAANDYHVVSKVLGSIGKIDTAVTKATRTRNDIPANDYHIIVIDRGSIGKITPELNLVKAGTTVILKARTSFRDWGSIGKMTPTALVKAKAIVLLCPCAHKDRDACDTSAAAYVGSFVTY